MSTIETVSVIGTAITMLGLLAVTPVLLAMSNNIGNPSYPMMEVGIHTIEVILVVLIPTGFLGYVFLFAEALK